jgi:flagellar basal body-associated protein FliL
MKKLTPIIIVLSILILSFAGCVTHTDTSNSAVLGQWASADNDAFVYTFNPDGTGTYTYGQKTDPFTYTDDSTEEVITITFKKGTDPSIYSYSADEKSLNLTDSFGDTTRYFKKDLTQTTTDN